jgi:hypothetical protein
MIVAKVKKKKKKKKKREKKKSQKKSQVKMHENNQANRKNDKNAILWTPLLTPFAQMDMLAPKRLGFLLYGERVERNLTGHHL